MGSLIHYIIENNVPSNWNLNYVSYFRPYVQLKLDNDTREYKKIFNLVQSRIISAYKNTYGIESIFRIQHPWSFASYQLRFSQVSRRKLHLPTEYLYISFLQENDNLELFLTNNCDRRILKNRNKNVKLAYALVEKRFDYNGRTSSYPDYILKLTYRKSNSDVAKLSDFSTSNQKQLSLPKMKESKISYNDDLSNEDIRILDPLVRNEHATIDYPYYSYASYGSRFPSDGRYVTNYYPHNSSVSYGSGVPEDGWFDILKRYLCMVLVGGCLSCSIFILMKYFIL